jgi:lipid A 3-O-deacylase
MSRLFSRTLLAAFLVLGLSGGSARAQWFNTGDGEPAFLTFQGGAFDVLHEETRGAQLGLQYRPAFKFLYANPMFGINGSTVGNAYIYGGVSFDIFIGNRLVLRPSFGPGLFLRNGGKDLGHIIEFRTGVELAWRLDDRSRIGVEISHRSNAGLGDGTCPCNPGEESLLLSYHLPLR